MQFYQENNKPNNFNISFSFPVGDNYSMTNLNTSADMIHSNPRNGLKTQQEMFCEGCNVS